MGHWLIIVNVLYSAVCLKKNSMLDFLEIHFETMLTMNSKSTVKT